MLLMIIYARIKDSLNEYYKVGSLEIMMRFVEP